MASTNSATDRTLRIRDLNDALRRSFIGGEVVVTRGVAALDGRTQQAILKRVRSFASFDGDNDPNGEHDFGRVDVDGHSVFFKIDYYDRNFEFASPDAADPSVTARVLTIMLADEY